MDITDTTKYFSLFQNWLINLIKKYSEIPELPFMTFPFWQLNEFLIF